MNPKNKEIILAARELCKKDNSPYYPYSDNFKKIIKENGILFSQNENYFFFNTKTQELEGNFLIKEKEFSFKGNLKNNKLEGKQEIYTNIEDMNCLTTSFEVEGNKIKNIKKIKLESKEITR